MLSDQTKQVLEGSGAWHHQKPFSPPTSQKSISSELSSFPLTPSLSMFIEIEVVTKVQVREREARSSSEQGPECSEQPSIS